MSEKNIVLVLDSALAVRAWSALVGIVHYVMCTRSFAAIGVPEDAFGSPNTAVPSRPCVSGMQRSACANGTSWGLINDSKKMAHCLHIHRSISCQDNVLFWFLRQLEFCRLLNGLSTKHTFTVIPRLWQMTVTFTRSCFFCYGSCSLS